MRLYLVMAAVGEYSDCTQWPIAAYSDEAKAQDHAERSLEWEHSFAVPAYNRGVDREKLTSPYDHKGAYYDPFSYNTWVEGVDLREAVPDCSVPDKEDAA